MPLVNKAGATGLPTMDREGAGCTILQTGYVSQGWTHIVGLYSRGGHVSQLQNWIGDCKIVYISLLPLFFDNQSYSPTNANNRIIKCTKYFITTNKCTIDIITVYITTVSLYNLHCYRFRHFTSSL